MLAFGEFSLGTDIVHARQQMLWHRKRAHLDGKDAAVAFFHSHREACGPGHFNRGPRAGFPTLCALAHKQWELNGADLVALTLGSVVVDAVVYAQAVWFDISDG